jgi:hypothetical protein
MRTLEVEFLGKFESMFENALAYESGDQLGCFGEITVDKKSHATVPLKRTCSLNCKKWFQQLKPKLCGLSNSMGGPLQRTDSGKPIQIHK